MEADQSFNRSSPVMNEIKKLIRHLRYFPLFLMTGVSAGIIGYLFRVSVEWAGKQRTSHPLFLFLLPAAGIAVHFLYRYFLSEKPSGAKSVITAVKENKPLSIFQLPLVFLASVITHLSGGSSGREGAVLEMGGVIGDRAISFLRRSTQRKHLHHLHLVPSHANQESEREIAILCGMAGAFSALFVTPLAAIFFVLEITDNHQIIHRFVPVFLVSFISFGIVCFLGWEPISLPFYLPNPLPNVPFLKTVLLAAASGVIGRFFCFSIKEIPCLFSRCLKNDYIRILTASTAVILLTCLLRTTKFNGLGSEIIQAAIAGKAGSADFFWKTLFTALTLAAGLKGGEIIPVFFVGATFGVSFSEIIGFLPDFGGAIGMVAIFAAVTKTPIAASLLGIEIFGIEGGLFFVLASCTAWFISGKQGLYR